MILDLDVAEGLIQLLFRNSEHDEMPLCSALTERNVLFRAFLHQIPRSLVKEFPQGRDDLLIQGSRFLGMEFLIASRVAVSQAQRLPALPLFGAGWNVT